MSNDNISDGANSADAVSETTDQSVDSALNGTDSAKEKDRIKNLQKEFKRKFSKIDDKLDTILRMYGSFNQQQQNVMSDSPVVKQSADKAAPVEDVRAYVNDAFNHQRQVESWQEALALFPELNPDSDDYDSKFYKAVDAEFSTNLRKDPRGPLKAAKLVAVEQGRVEQLTKASLLKDEARRARILSEGTSQTREAKKEKDPAAGFNVKNLARLGIDADKLAKRIKANKDKYEGM